MLPRGRFRRQQARPALAYGQDDRGPSGRERRRPDLIAGVGAAGFAAVGAGGTAGAAVGCGRGANRELPAVPSELVAVIAGLDADLVGARRQGPHEADRPGPTAGPIGSMGIASPSTNAVTSTRSAEPLILALMTTSPGGSDAPAPAQSADDRREPRTGTERDRGRWGRRISPDRSRRLDQPAGGREGRGNDVFETHGRAAGNWWRTFARSLHGRRRTGDEQQAISPAAHPCQVRVGQGWSCGVTYALKMARTSGATAGCWATAAR